MAASDREQVYEKRRVDVPGVPGETRPTRVFWECGACLEHVGPHDRFCRMCGVRFMN